MSIGIDGELYVLKNAKSITFSIDKECPKVKVLRRVDAPNFNEQNKIILTDLKNEFQPTLF